MTLRNREEHLAASEEFSPYNQPGSFLFSHPSEVKYWCQSIPSQDGLPLTPPDTASDCANSEYAEMNPSWSQTTMPDEKWSTETAQDNSIMTQGPANEWSHRGTTVTSQDLQALNASAWLQASQGPVDLGLSPVLSHESQSTHTLNSFSEPDTPLLPPGLDLSFISDAAWNPSGPVTYSSTHKGPRDFSTGLVSPPQTVLDGLPAEHVHQSYHSASSVVCGPPQQMYFYPSADVHRPGSVASDQTPNQGRTMLPRTDVQFGPAPQFHGQYRALQPHLTGPEVTRPTASVSSASGRPKEAVVSRPASIHSAGYADPPRGSPNGQVRAPYPDVASVPYFVDSTSQDFSNFIRYDQEDPVSAESMRLPSSCGSVAAPSPATAMAPSIPADGPMPFPAMSSGVPSVSNETDEGRHRNHPLYSEGPCADGLYHCPFASDPSCQHKPTKLKCNYDKFVDSHLKPFRCKHESCSKQEFSSTACLLRHEREAHGMHGHGDRPHLCFYAGCERGIPGNGFPRRYNLFDHMKRVHDHKEELSAQDKGTPDSQRSRKPASRKRKSSSPADEAPAAQRVKTQVMQEHAPMMAIPPAAFPHQPMSASPELVSSAAYHQRMPSDPHHTRQRILYSQWANQRELLEFQMSAVRSPDDEANLQRLSQNIEELRRLSQQARLG
ncbi:unnamed protein product [Zymoseptoria tritici ST99CH_3D1]|nr:unnamed protein product [Zymoseptoria tritici ST99CH_3D1]